MPLMQILDAHGAVVRTEDWPRSAPNPSLGEGESARRFVRGDRMVFPKPPELEAIPPKRYSLVDKEGAVQNVVLWDGVSPIDFGPGLTARLFEEGDKLPPTDKLAGDELGEQVDLILWVLGERDEKSDAPESKPTEEPTPEPAPPLPERGETGETPVDDKIHEEGEEPALITKDEVDDLLGLDEAAAAELVRAMKSERRRRFTELLHAELSDLINLRGVLGEDRKREADIERLLGLFARLGEI